MIDIFRADAHTNHLNPGTDWNPFLRGLEALSASRADAVKLAGQHILSFAIHEDLAADLPTTAANFLQAASPPLSHEEEAGFADALKEALVVQRSMQDLAASLERRSA